MTDRRWTEARLSAVERTWAPRSVVADDGIERGLRLIELRGLGGLDLDVEPDQFLDLGRATFRGEPLSFTAAGTSRLAETWTRRWRGGLLATCGLEAVGQAPEEQGGVHGRAHRIPAQVTRSEGCWDSDAYVVAVEGVLREAALLGPNLSVRRTITGTIGESVRRIHDVVRNDAGGWASAELAGARGRFTVAFRPEQLPFVTIWRSSAAGNYALGLEPGTCWPAHAEGPDRGKTGIELAPSESHEIDLTLTVTPR